MGSGADSFSALKDRIEIDLLTFGTLSEILTILIEMVFDADLAGDIKIVY